MTREDGLRFDVHWHEHGPALDYHFCREWDGDHGCYGTNPDHGYTFAEAVEQMRQWHLSEAERLSQLTYKEWAGEVGPAA